ncbi:hypothetical protein RFI_23153 [Reticulomyxa filosa]|uniref:RING-type E3 ubiquitin transferase n=1 Tax=Reticulomyxa filosa TaxID=46433 RepID=X6MMA2_RETFI|nr:hypothetical protein RFI_23153 [Reticulomyxa filosa]|eukprot:ETO14215.1 hypothetical protein RFI_23153 [Reticulomyxa filosa]
MSTYVSTYSNVFPCGKTESVDLNKLPREDKDEIKNEDAQSGNNNNSQGFDCNICFDVCSDPVVTCCGHLYCWQCLEKWLDRSQTCPVCQGGISHDTITPIYGKGKNKSNHAKNLPPKDKSTRSADGNSQGSQRPRGRRQEASNSNRMPFDPFNNFGFQFFTPFNMFTVVFFFFFFFFFQFIRSQKKGEKQHQKNFIFFPLHPKKKIQFGNNVFENGNTFQFDFRQWTRMSKLHVVPLLYDQYKHLIVL